MNKRLFIWTLLCLIWGSTWLFIKIGLGDLPPVSFAGLRFVVAASVLLIIVRIRRAPFPRARRDWLTLAITGFLAFTLNYGLLFWGEQRTSSGLAAILQAMIPVFGLIIAHYHLKAERMTISKVSGVVVGILGVALVFSNQIDTNQPGAVWGSGAIVLGAFVAAYSNVLVKARCGHIDPAVLASGQMFFGLIPLVLIGLAIDGSPLRLNWTARAVVSLFYLALVGSSLAFILFYWLVRRMSVSNTMLIPLVTPVIAVLLGGLFLHEELTWRLVLGALGIMTGILMAIGSRLKREVFSSP